MTKDHSCLDHLIKLQQECEISHSELYETVHIAYCPLCEELMKLHEKDTPNVHEIYTIRPGFALNGLSFTPEEHETWLERLPHYNLEENAKSEMET